MAGSNNIPKYALVNREDELLEFKTRGVAWSQTGGTLITTLNPLTTTLMMQPFFLSSASPNSNTGPTEALLLSNFFGQGYLSTVGSTAQVVVQNTDVVSKDFTFPGVGTVTIPPQSYYTIGFVVDAPGSVAFYNPIPSGATPIIPFGQGIVVENNGTYVLRTIVSGNPNILVANGNGVAGNPTISFQPFGPSLSHPTQLATRSAPVTIPYFFSNDFLVWDQTGAWNSSLDILPNTVPTCRVFLVSDNMYIGLNETGGAPPLAADIEVTGRQFQVIFDTFGTPGFTNTDERWSMVHSNRDILQANLTNSTAIMHHYTAGLNTAPGPFDLWRYRVVSYSIGNGVPGAGFNHNVPLNRKELFSVDGAGNVYGQAFSGTAFVVVSSKENKKSIEPASQYLEGGSALELISKLDPIAYRYKHQDDDSAKNLGLLVEDVSRAGGLDFLVHSEKDSPSHIRTDQLPFLLLQAMKELLANFQKKD